MASSTRDGSGRFKPRKKPSGGQPGNLNNARSIVPILKRLRRGVPLPPQLAFVERVVAKEAQGLIEDKGGRAYMSNAELALVENWKVARTAIALILGELAKRGLIVEKNGSWDMSPALRCLAPFLNQERSALVALGLERRAKPVPSLQDYIEATYSEEEDNE